MDTLQFNKNQKKHLCALIGISVSDLTEVLSNINSYYKTKEEDKVDKTTGEPKRYKDGTMKKRVITPSYGLLKKVQAKTNRMLQKNVVFPNNIHGSIKGKSNISNAIAHKGKKYRFTTDLKDFFPTINNKLVYNGLIKSGFTNVQANWITKLTTYKHSVPQGAPTSSTIANISFLEIDYVLIEYCKKHNITYTRYVDDLTFSSPCDFKSCIKDLIEIITSTGFKISFRKTSYAGDAIITGIDVRNNYIDVKNETKQKLEETKDKYPAGKNPVENYVKRVRSFN